MSVQNLKPTIDEIKRLYGDDKNKVQRETSELYKKSGVNPAAGMHALLPHASLKLRLLLQCMVNHLLISVDGDHSMGR